MTLAVLTAGAQQRIPCIHHAGGAGTRGGTERELTEYITEWDANRVYCQPVVLITYKDCDFSMDDPVAYYNRILNEQGYNKGAGKGLLIFHVDFDEDLWGRNKVNGLEESYDHYTLFHADDKDYMTWNPESNEGDPERYTMDNRLRSSYLSTSPYPYTNTESGVVNQELTNTSKPSATLFHKNAEGIELMSKSITNIQMDENGYLSFDFMANATGIEDVTTDKGKQTTNGWYTLDGRQLNGKPTQRGMYVHAGKVVVQ